MKSLFSVLLALSLVLTSCSKEEIQETHVDKNMSAKGQEAPEAHSFYTVDGQVKLFLIKNGQSVETRETSTWTPCGTPTYSNGVATQNFRNEKGQYLVVERSFDPTKIPADDVSTVGTDSAYVLGQLVTIYWRTRWGTGC